MAEVSSHNLLVDIIDHSSSIMTKTAAVDAKPAPPKKGAATVAKKGAPSKTLAQTVFAKSFTGQAVAMAKPPKTKPCVNWSGLCDAVATEAVLTEGDLLFVGITLKKRKGANAGPGYSAGELPVGLRMEHNGKIYITQEVVAPKAASGKCTRWKVLSGN